MTPPLPERAELLHQWHEHADAVFRRLFPEDAPPTVPACDRLETQTVQLANDLAAGVAAGFVIGSTGGEVGGDAGTSAASVRCRVPHPHRLGLQEHLRVADAFLDRLHG